VAGRQVALVEMGVALVEMGIALFIGMPQQEIGALTVLLLLPV
jgi:hypothetical protein